jgi:hypothetical protein
MNWDRIEPVDVACPAYPADRPLKQANAAAFRTGTDMVFMVAGGGFEPPTFGLCDLTHLSMRVGLYLHPHAFPHHSGGLVRYCPIAHAT